MPTNASARMWHPPSAVTPLGHSPPGAPALQFALAQPSALLHTPACKLIRTHSACVHAERSRALHACQRVRALCCINSWLCCCGHVASIIARCTTWSVSMYSLSLESQEETSTPLGRRSKLAHRRSRCPTTRTHKARPSPSPISPLPPLPRHRAFAPPTRLLAADTSIRL